MKRHDLPIENVEEMVVSLGIFGGIVMGEKLEIMYTFFQVLYSTLLYFVSQENSIHFIYVFF